MTNLTWFIRQAVVAEENLIRLALELEKVANKNSHIHDLINDCLCSANLLRDSRENAKNDSDAEAVAP